MVMCYLRRSERLSAVALLSFRTASRSASHSNIYSSQWQCVTVRTQYYSTSDRLTDFQKLGELHADISGGRLGRDRSFINTVTHEVTNVLDGATQPNKYTSQALFNLLYLLGRLRYFYDLPFYDSVSDMLLTLNNEDVYLCLLPVFLWSCANKQYYPRPLLEHVGQFILDNMAKFNSKDLSMIVTACSRLNHHLPQLIPRVEKRLLYSGDLQNVIEMYLAWDLAWAGIVFKDHPKELLTVVLSDGYIQGTSTTVM